MSTQQDIYVAGSKNRPPMLNKENYVPWSSYLLRYAKSRPNGKLIHNSILNGPYVRRMIPEPGDPARTVPVPETFHEQTDDELTEAEIKQIEVDDQAIHTILLGLLEDIYAAADSCETAQEIWFTSTDGESVESYYHRFSKLMNDFKRNKHFPEKIDSNLKFLNNLQPEWRRHVTIVHQTKDLHTSDYTQLYDFLKYNQKEVDELRAERLGKSHDPLALNANQIGNGNVVAARAEGNVVGNNGNQIRCYNCRGLGHLARNCTARPRRRDAAYLQTQLLIAQKEEAGIQLQTEEFDFMAAAGDLDEIEEVDANCILMANLQQASSSGTQIDKAPVYDSDGSAEVHNYNSCYDNKIFNMFTQEEQYTDLLEPIPKPHLAQQNDTMLSLMYRVWNMMEKANSDNRNLKATNAELTTELARYKNQEKCFEISQDKYDKLERCYQQSIYQEQCLSKKINAIRLSSGKQITALNEEISNLNKQLSMEKSIVSSLLEEKKKLKSDFKIREDELLDKKILLENKIKELDNILVKMGQSIQTMHMLSPKPDSFYHTEQKMALGYQNPFYLKKAQQKQQSLYNGKVLLEKHDPPVVYDSEETLQLAQESQAAKFVRDFKSLANEADESLDKQKTLEREIDRLLRVVVSQEIITDRKSEASHKVRLKFWETVALKMIMTASACSNVPHSSCYHLLSRVIGITRLSDLVNFDTINDLARNDLVTGLPKFKYHKEHLCPSCEQGKSKRASHPPKPVPNSKQRLHLLHMDLCGPMRIASINGKRYVLVIVDDYSRYTWVHFLRSKDEAPEVIKTFLKRITVLLQSPVIIIRTDNGTEFKNQILKEYFDSVGISHQASSVRTPQQNGVVERRNRTLVEAARTMLIFSRAPLFLWAENDREDIRKLGAKGDIGFFIGYSADSCAYRVYNRRIKKIMETMNVTFDELSAMAFEQNSSKPGLQSMTSGQISPGLDLTYAPSIITTQKPTKGDLDLLFKAIYDDYLGGQPSAATRTVLDAQAPPVLQNQTTSIAIADSAPTPTNSSSQAPNTPNTSQDVDELET
ncbi:putative ribonuclease H-like domain-containing protein [Tanacetum coccineum]